MELKNKTIILTGAARIGQDIAETLQKQGANLVITYFKNPEEAGPFGFPVQADLTKKEDIYRLVENAKKKFGQIDGLIHMAAIYEKTEWDKLDENYWEKNMNVIAKSSYLLGKITGDEMLKNEPASAKASADAVKGKMIFFSDWSVLTRPYKDYLLYNTAKSAVIGLTKSFAKELAPHILVNAIAPGPILKPPDLSERENKEVMSGTPLKRWGGPKEITKGICYLLETDFVTGTVLTIDGGRTIA
jgi:NAD(P)-dependent dehydrogenase (short-subunit alcohol dehydrogenase family)